MIRLSHPTGVRGRHVVESAWRVFPSRPAFNSQALSGLAGPSRQPFAPTYGAAAYSTHSALRKGKQLEAGWASVSSLTTPSSREASTLALITRWRGHAFLPDHRHNQIRLFHATARRQALPIIPVTLGILKSTTVLAVATTIARILISFFPIGTIAAFKLSRGVRWLESEDQRPDVSPAAEEFWKMWCQDEKAVRPTLEEAADIPNGTMMPDGGCLGPNGKISYATPVQGKRYRPPKSNDDPTTVRATDDNGNDNRKRIAKFIRGTRFYLPDLPPASIPYYERLSTAEQAEVTKFRRYWISLKVFKHTLRWARWVMMVTLIFPFFLVFSVYAFGLERVPLTGRWRVVLLTPEEEDAISTSLSGANWYRSVINLLTTPERPAPTVVPIEDWRWNWVHGVLRRLEAGALAECHGKPMPFEQMIKVPPVDYPLKPRPRVSCMLHSALPGAEPSSGKEHLEIGPPYSLMLMEKDERNAFSYGFGGKGAGGVVVYTGLLDSILREGVGETAEPVPTSRGFLAGMFSSTPPRPPTPLPTELQTLHLACVLAHEMGHLLLSHHLETLSQQQVLWPSILGLSVDLTRAFIWPITFLLGPTVNDALANVGKTSTDEISERYGQIGFQWKHEYEADLVGLRLLALAGYDPYAALDHFTNSVADLHEIEPLQKDDESFTGRIFKLWTTATHPTPEQRTEAIRTELAKWATEPRDAA